MVREWIIAIPLFCRNMKENRKFYRIIYRYLFYLFQVCTMPQAFAAALLLHRKGAYDAQKDVTYLFNRFHLDSNNTAIRFYRQRSACESPASSEG
jgi:hypothetical protein